MKPLFCVFSCLLSAMAAFSQIPNGNFEEWETVDSIESPTLWQTNNYYVGYTPIDKISNAISGNYSMKISSTARDLYSHGSWPGCAYLKFKPTEIYPYMTASVRIDSIKNGEIEIRVKQRAADGFFYRIGGWKRSTLTNGTKTIWFPIEYTQLDTLMIDIWAFNRDEVYGGPNYGYSGAIIDNLQLTNTVATEEEYGNETAISWQISPNPAHDFINISLEKRLTKPCQLKLYDINGTVRITSTYQTFKEEKINVFGLASGIYVLELNQDGQVLHRSRVMVLQQ
jgi:Secretion system C-terminal sorting domain